MKIKDIRLSKGLTQTAAANIVGLKLRTYQNYENGNSFRDTFKINQITKILSEYEKYTEDKGILTKEEIVKLTKPIFDKYKIEYAYLFGSYAKNRAKDNSDVDILISDEVKGFKFVDIQNELNKTLHKKIDLLRMDDIRNNDAFLTEILKTGVRIYG